MLEKKKLRLVDFKVDAVKQLATDHFGFDVHLIYPDGTFMIQEKRGYETASEAQTKRDETVGLLYAGKYTVYDDVTVEEFMTYWLEDVMKIKITACSYDAYANIVNNHILPFFRAKNLRLINNIKMAHVQQLYNEKANYSHAVARLVKTVMNTSMEYARTNNIISRNPAKGVNLPKSMEIKKGFRTRSIDASKTLTLEQIKVLLDKSRDTPIHMQILFAVLMGLRRGEINGLKYSDVDYMNQTLTVRRQLGKAPNTVREDFQAKTFTKQEIRLKTDSSYRTLPIPDYVFEEILKERKKYEANRKRRINDKNNPFYDGDYICCSTYGKPRSKVFHFKYYKKLLQENNLPDIRWHDLRSTFCTLLIKNNYSPKAISKLMGHAKEIITLDIYGDNAQIIADGVEEIQPFMNEVMPKKIDLHEYLCDTEVNMDMLIGA